MKRIYQSVIEEHLKNHKQMIILAGPKAIGKTALCKEVMSNRKSVLNLNWSNLRDRELILAGPEKLYDKIQAPKLVDQLPVIILNDLYLHKDWKNLLKGYYDVLSDRCRFIITVSEKVDTYHSRQDSMMGRYFSYTIHPLTIAELCQRNDFSSEYVLPRKISLEDWNGLLEFGGFPEPFQKATKSFHTRWVKSFRENIIGDARELSRVNNLQLFGLLAQMLLRNVGRQTNFSQIARDLQTSVPTVQHWHDVLCNHYFCFEVSPWSSNIKRSLLKVSKYYLYDWSQITGSNATTEYIKIENFVGCHLKKAVDFWNDTGIGQYELRYLRDKEGREVDFLVVKNQKPWLMLDVKKSQNSQLSKSLLYFSQQLQVPHVFQVVEDMPYIDKDCFAATKPVIVPMTTFLSQLV